jgi:hypothetical protein
VVLTDLERPFASDRDRASILKVGSTLAAD